MIKNISLKGNGVIQTDLKELLAWDIYGHGIRLNDKGWKIILSYLNSLPNEAFKTTGRCNYFSLGHSYSYINFNKEYYKLNKDKLIEDFLNILIDKSNFESNEDFSTEIVVWQKYPNERKAIMDKYLSWIKKKEKPIKEIKEKEYNRFRILQRDGFKCKICGRHPPEVTLHIDHWFPKARGGEDKLYNLITLCSDCNLSKSDQIPINKIEEIRDR